MRIERVSVSRINPAAYNPRKDLKPGDAEYEKLERSIAEFGLVEPLVWNRRTRNLVGGHHRFKVLLEQGASEVEVSVVDLSLEKEKALNVALNKIQGKWDEAKLAELLDELCKAPDFEVEVTGFDLPEVEHLLHQAGLDDDWQESFDVTADLEAGGQPVTKPGDMIELGPHRLLCGHSSEPEDIRRLIKDEQAHMVFTDPPYNVDYYGGDRPQPKKARPKRSRNWRRIYSDDLSQGEYEGRLARVLEKVKEVLAPGAPVYVWNGHRQFGPMHLLLQGLGFKVSCVITWAKESFAIGYGDYNQQTEFCLYGWLEGRGAHRWYGPTNESTLWEVSREHTSSYHHPTQKPLELAERAIRNSSRPGELVLDVFLGSGTTLIAAERLGRRCYGIEIDPRYCDVVVRRYIACVGESNVPSELVEHYRLLQSQEV